MDVDSMSHTLSWQAYKTLEKKNSFLIRLCVFLCIPWSERTRSGFQYYDTNLGLCMDCNRWPVNILTWTAWHPTSTGTTNTTKMPMTNSSVTWGSLRNAPMDTCLPKPDDRYHVGVNFFFVVILNEETPLVVRNLRSLCCRICRVTDPCPLLRIIVQSD